VVAAKRQAIARTRSRPKIDGRGAEAESQVHLPRVSSAGQGGLAAAISRVGNGNSSAPLSPVALPIRPSLWLDLHLHRACLTPVRSKGKHSGMDLNGRGAGQGKNVPNSADTCSSPVRDRGSLTPAGARP
jgi:hypothetical protein